MGAEERGGGAVRRATRDGTARRVRGAESVRDGESATARRRRGIRAGAVAAVFDVSRRTRGERDMVSRRGGVRSDERGAGGRAGGGAGAGRGKRGGERDADDDGGGGAIVRERDDDEGDERADGRRFNGAVDGIGVHRERGERERIGGADAGVTTAA